MKRYLLATTLLNLLAVVAGAQITLTNASFPSVGDTLFTATDNLPSGISVGAAGGPRNWDFTTLQAPFTQQNIVKPADQGENAALFPDADAVMGFTTIGEGYYKFDDQQIRLIGVAGQDIFNLGLKLNTRLAPSLVDRRAPVNYQDTYNDQTSIRLPFASEDLPSFILDSLPITPDSFRIRITIQRTDVADGWGAMTIPGGIYDVLRIKRTQIQSARIDAKLSFFGWQDITDIVLQFLDGFDQFFGDNLLNQYLFLSNEAKEPIAVVTMNTDNTAPASVEYKSNFLINKIEEQGRFRPGVTAYPNPAVINVRFAFTHLTPGAYTLSIYNVLGAEVFRQQYDIWGDQTERVDVSRLSRGAYLYRLQNKSGRTLMTKRLVIIRP